MVRIGGRLPGWRPAAIRLAMNILLATITGWTATAAPVTITDPSEDDLRLLEVVLAGTVLSEATAGYAGPGGGTLLPLGGMSEILGIALTVDSKEGFATGFVLDEQRTFHLDVGRREVTIAGRVSKFTDSLVHLYQDDIYVDAVLLGEWLPIAFDLDLFALRVTVRPREPLPLQLRLERERLIRHWRLRLMPRDPGYPRVRTGFRMWEMPSVDQTLRFSLDEDESRATFSTYATGDLLFMESETFLSGSDEDPLETSRFTLRRRDPYGSLGGWLQATELAMGHVIYPRSGLLANSSDPQPGFLLTNLPLNRPDEFDRHSFRGNLPSGWDVELYHNGSLIDYQPSRPDGQYEFQDVPLLFGMNFFRLVFYGPQGQRREEDHRFLLGDSLTLPGRFEYRLIANAESGDTRRGSMLLSYGISRHLTATAELSSLPIDLGDRTYGKFGLRTFWNAVYGYGDYVQDEAGGHAWEGGLQTRIYGVNLLLHHTGLSRDFISESFPFSIDPIRTIDRLRLDTAIPAWILPRIPLTLQVEQQRLASGSVRTVARNRISANYKGLSLSNLATWTTETDEPSLLEGSFQVSRYIRRVGLRGELLYTLEPTTASTANLTIERSLGLGYRAYANVSRSFLSDSHIYSIGIAKTTGLFAAGVDTTRRTDGSMSANINLSAGLGHEPRQGIWIPGAESKASFGAVSVRVFLDRDNNGVFGGEDELLPRIGVTVNGVRRPERSSDEGILFIDRLPPHLAADIAIDTSTLEDPQWVPDEEGARIVSRPGKTSALDVPLIETSEIEGTVYTVRRGKRGGLAGVAVELVDSVGNVVRSTITAYDGFYVLTHVRSGTYTLRVSPRRTVQFTSSTVDLEKPLAVPEDAPFVIVADFELPSGEEQTIVVSEETPAPPVLPEVESGPTDLSRARPVSENVPPSAPPQHPGEYIVQVGAFIVADNAHDRAETVRDLVSDVAIIRKGEYYLVRTGPRTRIEAETLSRRLESRGIESLIMRFAPYVVQIGAFAVADNARRQLEIVREIVGDAAIVRTGDLYVVRAIRRSRSEGLSLSRELESRGIESFVTRSRSAPEPGTGAARNEAARPSFLVQLGAFSIQNNAVDLVRRVEEQEALPRASVEQRKDLYFVTSGPYSSRVDALAARDRFRRAGFEAIMVSSTR